MKKIKLLSLTTDVKKIKRLQPLFLTETTSSKRMSDVPFHHIRKTYQEDLLSIWHLCQIIMMMMMMMNYLMVWLTEKMHLALFPAGTLFPPHAASRV